MNSVGAQPPPTGMTNASTDKVRGRLKSEGVAHMEKKQVAHGVREEVRSYMRIGKANLRVGIVEDKFIKAHWFLGNAGRCEWVLTRGEPRLKRRGDPCYIRREDNDVVSAMERSEVDVVFFGGQHPPKDGRFWRNEVLKGVVWVARRRATGAIRVPSGWTITSKRISHSNVGGVTDAAFWVEVAVRDKGGLRWQAQTRFVGNVLKQIVDSTIGGRQCLPVKDSFCVKKNTALGLLEWRNRFGLVTVPTVYSKEKWAKRKLSTKELCDALDLPGHVVAGSTKNDMDKMAEVEIPGKILQCAFQGFQIDEDSFRRRKDHTGKRRGVGGEGEGGCKRAKSDSCVPVTGASVQRDETNRKMDPEGVTPEMARLRRMVEDQDTTVTDKAVKSDNARVPVHLWNLKVIEGCKWTQEQFVKDPDFRRRCFKSFDVLRSWLLGEWKKRVERSFHTWFHNTEHISDKREDLWNYGTEAVKRARRCSWWNWNGGSSIFFWRWPDPYRSDATYGAKARLDKEPPSFWEAQPPIDSEEKRKLIQPKVDKVLQNGYVKFADPDSLRSLLFMFDVPKGSDDIRLVCDGSKSGLNDSLWAPWFSLPTVETMCRTLEPGYWCADNDYGDQFLNFPLDKDIQPYCGIDLSQLYPEKAKESENLLTAIWTRNAMGLKTSPYASVQGALRAKRIIMGDTVGLGDGDSNPFAWSTIRKNYPGSEGYDPSRPWIAKIDEEGLLACDLHQYVDDLRITAKDAALAWRASSRVAKVCSFLGLQDAARKRRAPSQEPGAWAGAVVTTVDGKVQKSVTQERWDKTKRKVHWLAAQAGCDMGNAPLMDGVFDDAENMKIGEAPPGCMHHKLAEKYRGFLVYASRTHTSMVPFLKGLHLTLDNWRANRDEDGWKLTNTLERKFECWEKPTKAKTFVPMATRFKDDMEALVHLTRHEAPPRIPVRPSRSMATYLVGDASGSGYGATLWTQGDESFVATHGGWTEELSGASSNEREAYNLILNVEAAIKSGDLERGTELFVFTDNMVSERCFHSGRSKSRGMHALTMKMHDLVMQGEIFAHFVWISGERMKRQGGDGLSRGDLNTGVLKGDQYLSHIPLAEDAFSRHGFLKTWLQEALPGEDWVFLEEEDWCGKAFENPKGKYVWSPPPCVADACLEQACEVKHIHPESSHVFVCPALMTYNWRKQLRKLSDVQTTIKEGAPIWPKRMLEPLTISLISPLLSHRPWTMARTGFVAEWESDLSRMYGGCPKIAGSYLRKFWLESWNR